ncbi:unnamed protein product [Soboliphyme baturini]|uniref:Uncharacterized protein n=1 Tax=Soboliphyme baturini TaxID=241478 RepID=A0A183IFH0_9BILA|nr:unnamed protein product [Soboliphyme baturini]
MADEDRRNDDDDPYLPTVMNRGPSLKNFEPGYDLLKWAFLDESLALRVST